MIDMIYRRKSCRDFLKLYSEELYKDIIPDVFEIGVLSLLNSFDKAIFTKKELTEIILDLKNKEYIRNPQYRTLDKLTSSKPLSYYNDDKQFRKYYGNFSPKEEEVYPNWWWTLKDDEKENYMRNYNKLNLKNKKNEECQTIDFYPNDYYNDDEYNSNNNFNNQMMYSSPNNINYYNDYYRRYFNPNSNNNTLDNIYSNWNNSLMNRSYNNQNLNYNNNNRMIMNKLSKGKKKKNNNKDYYDNIQEKKNNLKKDNNENIEVNKNNSNPNVPPKKKISYKISYDKELKPEKIEKNGKDLDPSYTYYKGNIQKKIDNNNNYNNSSNNFNNSESNQMLESRNLATSQNLNNELTQSQNKEMLSSMNISDDTKRVFQNNFNESTVSSNMNTMNNMNNNNIQNFQRGQYNLNNNYNENDNYNNDVNQYNNQYDNQ
jgi:hypothetical protein